MSLFVGGLALLASIVLVGFLAHRLLVERRAIVRLGSADEFAEGGAPGDAVEQGAAAPIRWRLEELPVAARFAIACTFGVFGALVAAVGFELVLPVACAIGFDLAIVVGLWLTSRREKYLANLEAQLAEAIRLTAAALKAGLGRIDALHRAADQVDAPLSPILLEAVGRLRLGESPQSAFGRLSERTPLETFRLFSMIIATQWHAGGSLQGTLASVGEFMQDRVDVQQRIASQAAPTRSSTLVLFAATSAIAYFSWTNDPFNLERFIASETGAWLVGITLALQGVALLWMDRLMRSRV